MPRENLYRAVMPGAELRAANDGGMPTMVGYATVWNAPTEINSRYEGRFIEKWQRGAFAKSIAERAGQIKVLLNHGHDPSVGDKPLGAITELVEDDHGLRYAVQLLDAPYVREILPALEAGLFGASHRFTMLRDQVVEKPRRSAMNPDALPERTVTEAKLHEFGPVTFPALDVASAGIRSLTDLVHDVDAVIRATPILLDEERTSRARIFLTRPMPEASDAADAAENASEPPERARAHELREKLDELRAAMPADDAEPAATLDGDTVEALGSLIEVCESALEAMESLLGIDDDAAPDADEMNSAAPEGDTRETAPPADSAEPKKAHPVHGRRRNKQYLYGQGKKEPKWRL